MRAFDDYLDPNRPTWFSRNHPDRLNYPIAYFSTEFGLHESLPFYAGGLGVLSGDHLKEASDLGLPLVAVGFLYTQGYFKQRITEDGWQEAHYASLAFENLPVLPVLALDSTPLTVSVDLPGRPVQARLWQIQVGRVPLPAARQRRTREPARRPRPDLAVVYQRPRDAHLAGDHPRTRRRARPARPGVQPATWHMNEGHSAFLEPLIDLDHLVGCRAGGVYPPQDRPAPG